MNCSFIAGSSQVIIRSTRNEMRNAANSLKTPQSFKLEAVSLNISNKNNFPSAQVKDCRAPNSTVVLRVCLYTVPMVEMTAGGCSVMHYTVTQHGAVEFLRWTHEWGTTAAHNITALRIAAEPSHRMREWGAGQQQNKMPNASSFNRKWDENWALTNTEQSALRDLTLELSPV